jgi:hypothetical protein
MTGLPGRIRAIHPPEPEAVGSNPALLECNPFLYFYDKSRPINPNYTIFPFHSLHLLFAQCPSDNRLRIFYNAAFAVFHFTGREPSSHDTDRDREELLGVFSGSEIHASAKLEGAFRNIQRKVFGWQRTSWTTNFRRVKRTPR